VAVGGVVGAAMLPGRERIEAVPGVYTRIPEGWALLSSSNVGETVPDSGGAYEVVLVPERLKNSDSSIEAGQKAASISLSTYPCSGPIATEVEDISPSDDMILEGYDRNFFATGTMTSGESTVAGREATWNLNHGFFAGPWTPPGEVDVTSDGYSFTAADYPTYYGSVSVELCLEELDVSLLYDVGGYLGAEERPTEERNASVAETREEIHDDIRERYEANFGALIQVLEDLSADGGGGPTELGTIPTSIRKHDGALEDPFQGKLEATLDSSEPPGGGLPGEEENLPPEEMERYGVEEKNPELAALEEFGRAYDEASRRGEWAETYSMLSEGDREEFTEEEWAEAQQALRDRDGAPPPLESVAVEPDEETTDSPATVTLRYEDGSEESFEAMAPMAVTSEEEEEAGDVGPERYLTEEEVAELRALADNPGDESDTSGGDEEGPEEEIEASLLDYYEAASAKDWYATYGLLTYGSQQQISEDEWVEAQEARDREEPLKPVESVEVNAVKGDGVDYVEDVDLTLLHEDGSETELEVQVAPSESGEGYDRHLTDEEVEYLEGLLAEEEGGGAGYDPEERAAVYDALYGHYEAIGRGSFEEAYSYFGPSFRARTSEEAWVAEEETFGITGSTINSVEVGEVSEDGTATATVDVSFEDNTGSPSFVIEWALVEEEGQWKLDEILSSSEGDA
jgi:methionine-rich copper-binding protein CopC